MNNKILIIDDSEVDRKIIGSIIRKHLDGIEVIESHDGIGVIETIKKNAIMMCILDLKMPNIDGVEILIRLKEDSETSDVPVIVCTGIMDAEMMERVLKLGAYDYFTKPFGEEAMKLSLPLKVRNAIELRRRTNEILHRTQVDDLTGLFNRRYFKALLDSLNTADLTVPATIMMCDINGLKLINDAYGNCAGDYFLKSASQILKKVLPSNSIHSRWGGDEFSVLIHESTPETVGDLINRIKLESEKIDYKGIQLNLAIGSDVITPGAEDVYKTLKNAEDAMFRDKILDNESVRSTMIATILHTLNVKNPREEEHSRRVSELCEKMGHAMNLSDHEIRDLKVIGLLHDIGKIAIDEKILNKPDRLTDEEYLEIKRHPEIGYRILSTSKEMDNYLEVILAHHERYDGKGYPNGLKEQEIPLMSRVLTIIDSFDAMTCHRPYRDTKSTKEAVTELLLCSGTQFDGDLVRIFVKHVVNA